MQKNPRIALMLSLALAGTTGCSWFSRGGSAEDNNALAASVVTRGLAKLKATSVPAGTPFKFGVLGDTRDGMSVMHEEIDCINAANAAFVLFTGDLVREGTEDEFKAGLAALDTFQMPVLAAPGHHERQNIANYTKYVQQPLDFAVDYAGWHFVSLDDSTGSVSDAQIKWLGDQLDGGLPSVIFAHEPPKLGAWTSGFAHNADAFNALVVAHPNCKACIFAHLHLYDHQVYHGVPYVVSGGGGAPIDTKLPLAAEDGYHGYNYLLCSVDGDRFSYEMNKVTDYPIRENGPGGDDDDDK